MGRMPAGVVEVRLKKAGQSHLPVQFAATDVVGARADGPQVEAGRLAGWHG